jgi:anti-sigma regulatory factor (Ser/Thr protein kinase)
MQAQVLTQAPEAGQAGAALRVTPPRSPHHALLATAAQGSSLRAVRRFAAVRLARWCLCDDDQDSALLIIGELAANAAQHGRADMALHLVLHPRTLQITVADYGPRCAAPAAAPDQDPAEHGRGLAIVRALACWVDIRHHANGHEVRAGLTLTLALPL